MRINIHYKITLIFVLIAAIVLLASYAYLKNNLTEYIYQRIRSNLTKETLLVRSLFEGDVAGRVRRERFDDIADKIGKDLKVRVTVIDIDGTVLGDSELNSQQIIKVENHLYRPEVQQALRSGAGESKRFSTTVQKNMLYVASTFGRDGPEGFVRLSMPLSAIEAISNRLKKILILALFVAFITATVISFIASIFISKPLKQMSMIASKTAGGDFSKKISPTTNDEIGDLAKTFDHMTDQIRARIEDVTSSKLRLEAIILSMFDGIMVVDLKGTILLMNRTLRDLWMIEEDPVGKKPLEIIRNIEIQEMVDSVLNANKGVESKEISILLPEEKVLLVHATPIVRESATEGAVLVFHDITELRRLEKMRQDFVANVSHELRTPVSNIKGYAETLLEGALNDKENAQDFLKIIHSDSDRLAKLIEDLLDLSRLQSGKLELKLKACPIRQVINKVSAALKKQAEKKSIAIDTDIPGNIPDMRADESLISQVLLNMIDNAIKYNKENGSIKIGAKEENKFIRIDVSDTGVGIPEADLPRVFERFYRVDKARSRQLGGTGLGLSIVKHIVQEHGGKVSVNSTAGKGSTFSFTIPKA